MTDITGVAVTHELVESYFLETRFSRDAKPEQFFIDGPPKVGEFFVYQCVDVIEMPYDLIPKQIYRFNLKRITLPEGFTCN